MWGDGTAACMGGMEMRTDGARCCCILPWSPFIAESGMKGCILFFFTCDGLGMCLAFLDMQS